MSKRQKCNIWKNDQNEILLQKFIDSLDKKFTEFKDLHSFSVQNLATFWSKVWDFCQIKYSKSYDKAIQTHKAFEKTKFFTGAKLNFAENVLRFRDKDKIAISFKAEDDQITNITYFELYQKVGVLAKKLRLENDIQPGDTVVGYLPNIPQAIIAMLAVTSVGGVWSSCSPDFGVKGVLDRFSQVKPKVMFTTDGYFYKAKRLDLAENVKQIVKGLSSLRKVIVIDYAKKSNLMLRSASDQNHPTALDPELVLNGKEELKCTTCSYAEYVKECDMEDEENIVFEQVGFDHPVYIMFTSGTTGMPKCMAQGFGVLLNHMKEHQLHLNLKRNDKLFYYTTTGWMMWNWLVSGLATGANIVLFDGNPLFPSPGALWKFCDNFGITMFGTSARYLAAVQAEGYEPKKHCNLDKLRMIMSTGSPATSHIFDFVYRSIKSDVQFASISGGTDLNGCFALGCPILPVRDGEIQALGLGLDVQVFNDHGERVVNGTTGELVCLQPFPSMPLYFLNDKDGSKYHNAYFTKFPNIWRHGDFVELSENDGLIMHGRSDATLNPGGVRIGTSDIYNLLEENAKSILDSLVIGLDIKLEDGTPDVQVVLFVVLHPDMKALTKDTEKELRALIRNFLSPRHVPSKIFACPEVPYTVSGKKVEIAVKQILSGSPISNKSALRNPESLNWFVEFMQKL